MIDLFIKISLTYHHSGSCRHELFEIDNSDHYGRTLASQERHSSCKLAPHHHTTHVV